MGLISNDSCGVCGGELLIGHSCPPFAREARISELEHQFSEKSKRIEELERNVKDYEASDDEMEARLMRVAEEARAYKQKSVEMETAYNKLFENMKKMVAENDGLKKEISSEKNKSSVQSQAFDMAKEEAAKACPDCGGARVIAYPNKFGEPENPEPCGKCDFVYSIKNPFTKKEGSGE